MDKIQNKKRCSLCGSLLPHEMFYKRASGPVESACKPCFKARVALWRNTPRGQEAMRRGRKKYADSEHGKAKIEAHQNTTEYKIRKALYDRTPSRKAYRKAYEQSKAGKARRKR